MGKDETKKETDAEAVERYRKLQAEGHHTLPYEEFLRARELGVELPEADPVYEVVRSLPKSLSGAMPEGVPLRECYRVTTELCEEGEAQMDNACLLAALGQLKKPFVPVWIDSDYDGYSWAKLPRIETVDVAGEEELQIAPFLASRHIECAKSLVITAHTSDGKKHSAPVCLAVAEPFVACSYFQQTIHVTPEARSRIPVMALLSYLGVPYYDTDLKAKLDDFWLGCGLDGEALRVAILDRLEMLLPGWETISTTEIGAVTIRSKREGERTLLPSWAKRRDS